jgi:hypothetical protein
MTDSYSIQINKQPPPFAFSDEQFGLELTVSKQQEGSTDEDEQLTLQANAHLHDGRLPSRESCSSDIARVVSESITEASSLGSLTTCFQFQTCRKSVHEIFLFFFESIDQIVCYVTNSVSFLRSFIMVFLVDFGPSNTAPSGYAAGSHTKTIVHHVQSSRKSLSQ